MGHGRRAMIATWMGKISMSAFPLVVREPARVCFPSALGLETVPSRQRRLAPARGGAALFRRGICWPLCLRGDAGSASSDSFQQYSPTESRRGLLPFGGAENLRACAGFAHGGRHAFAAG